MKDKVAQLQAKLDADPKFTEKLLNRESPEDVQTLLKGEGLDFNMEEIQQLRKAIVNSLQKAQGGELDEDALDNVAGGALVEINIDTINITPGGGGSSLPGEPSLPGDSGLPGGSTFPKW